MSVFRALKRIATIAGYALKVYLSSTALGRGLGMRLPAMPEIFAKTNDITGLKVEFNGAALPTGQTICISNHMSHLDIPVLGSLMDGVFVSKQEIENWPVFGKLGRDFDAIYISRQRHTLDEDRGKVRKALNKGHNIILYPEGTTTDGSDVRRFNAGLLRTLYHDACEGGHNEPLTSGVRVQPFAIRVKEVDGKPVTSQEQRDVYAWYDGNPRGFGAVWAFGKASSVVVEVRAFEPFDPKDYDGAEDLANAAQKIVKDWVTAPVPSMAQAV